MPRRPATIVQSDIARALRAAQQCGATMVELKMLPGQPTICTIHVVPVPKAAAVGDTDAAAAGC
jgi:hypothetical protein